MSSLERFIRLLLGLLIVGLALGCSESTVSEPTDAARPPSDTGSTEAPDLGPPGPAAGDPLEPLTFEVPEDGSPIAMRSALPTGIEHADVYLLVDSTASMNDEIDLLRRSITGPDGLVVSLREAIPDVRIGVGSFADYPADPYGSAADGDAAYTHRLDPTEDIAELQVAIDAIELTNGLDVRESLVPALWSMATGFGLSGPSGWNDTRADSAAWDDCERGAQGWPCFRRDAATLVVVVTDAPSHHGPSDSEGYDTTMLGAAPPTWAATRVALDALGARVVFVTTDGGRDATAMAETIAAETGAVDDAGEPLVFAAPPEGPSDIEPLVRGVRTLADRRYAMTLALITPEDSSLPNLVTSFGALGSDDPSLGCMAFSEGATIGPDLDLCVEVGATLDEDVSRGIFTGWLELSGDGRRLAARPLRVIVP